MTATVQYDVDINIMRIKIFAGRRPTYMIVQTVDAVSVLPLNEQYVHHDGTFRQWSLTSDVATTLGTLPHFQRTHKPCSTSWYDTVSASMSFFKAWLAYLRIWRKLLHSITKKLDTIQILFNDRVGTARALYLNFRRRHFARTRNTYMKDVCSRGAKSIPEHNEVHGALQYALCVSA
jgi:hypothetical protein